MKQNEAMIPVGDECIVASSVEAAMGRGAVKSIKLMEISSDEYFDVVWVLQHAKDNDIVPAFFGDVPPDGSDEYDYSELKIGDTFIRDNIIYQVAKTPILEN